MERKRQTERERHRDTRRQRRRLAVGGEWGAPAMALGPLEADGHDLMVIQGGVCFLKPFSGEEGTRGLAAGVC